MQALIKKFNINEMQIFRTICKYEPNLIYITEDALQEIRLVMLNGCQTVTELFRSCRSATDRLMRLYRIKQDGHCRYSAEQNVIYGDDGSLNYQFSYLDLLENKAEFKLQQILDFYESHTARETCERFGIEYNSQINKLMHRCAPKNMGHGGRRKGAGRKQSSLRLRSGSGKEG